MKKSVGLSLICAASVFLATACAPVYHDNPSPRPVPTAQGPHHTRPAPSPAHHPAPPPRHWQHHNPRILGPR